MSSMVERQISSFERNRFVHVPDELVSGEGVVIRVLIVAIVRSA